MSFKREKRPFLKSSCVILVCESFERKDSAKRTLGSRFEFCDKEPVFVPPLVHFERWHAEFMARTAPYLHRQAFLFQWNVRLLPAPTGVLVYSGVSGL